MISITRLLELKRQAQSLQELLRSSSAIAGNGHIAECLAFAETDVESVLLWLDNAIGRPLTQPAQEASNEPPYTPSP
jgi:hypothetical protein